MKKLICWALAVLLLLGLTTVAYAAETTCTVTADSVTAGAGEEVAVAVRITGNPGFTNFGISLRYDREKLKLERLETGAGEISGANLQWEDQDGSQCGYVTSASANAVTGDVVLFTAVFTTAEDFTGTAQVIPVVSYIRNNTALFSAFEEITATVDSGSVGSGSEGLLGDVNGDGKINAADASILRMYMRNKVFLSQEKLQAADVNGDEKINAADVSLIIMRLKNKLSKFPGEK